jgi:hypothetical protein
VSPQEASGYAAPPTLLADTRATFRSSLALKRCQRIHLGGCVGTGAYHPQQFSVSSWELVVVSFDSPRATVLTPWRGDREWLLRREALAAAWLLERAK